jgi:hypothetical protein
MDRYQRRRPVERRSIAGQLLVLRSPCHQRPRKDRRSGRADDPRICCGGHGVTRRSSEKMAAGADGLTPIVRRFVPHGWHSPFWKPKVVFARRDSNDPD